MEKQGRLEGIHNSAYQLKLHSGHLVTDVGRNVLVCLRVDLLQLVLADQ